LRSTSPIGGPAVSDNHRRFRRHIRGSRLASRPVGRGSLGGGRGAIAARWWSWHLGLISRDASRVQWIGGAAVPRSCKREAIKERQDAPSVEPGTADFASQTGPAPVTPRVRLISTVSAAV
jgi:hypothetical protein